MNTVFLVIPCYNEEEVLPETTGRLHEKMTALMKEGAVSADSRVVYVDDGSKDRTWELIESYHREYPALFDGLRLSRNEGHQNALFAGLMQVRSHCDAAISLDADLQDDINAIDEMIAKFAEGFEIVYGVRSQRKTDTAFKRMTAHGFYRFMDRMGVEVVYDHADYRLMSARALDGLSEFREVNLFLRGIVPLIGYRTAEVRYERAARFAGESKYPLKKMLSFAAQGITSFSVKPIHMITKLGLLIFAVSILLLLFLVFMLLFRDGTGWAFVAASVWALGGLQLFAVGLIGEYIGKTYLETKQRPKYLIDQWLHEEKDGSEI